MKLILKFASTILIILEERIHMQIFLIITVSIKICRASCRIQNPVKNAVRAEILKDHSNHEEIPQENPKVNVQQEQELISILKHIVSQSPYLNNEEVELILKREHSSLMAGINKTSLKQKLKEIKLECGWNDWYTASFQFSTIKDIGIQFLRNHGKS
ncbi:unnamed protein product [Blepharisma stoltei]|uniref:Uncharacterized protein n=1 Tax=Blepharisma stoltei TaxID=1481888 RepID=A0AAU9JDR9_9CILI|nr:unnamed protein product [Blepharisma stoltei]